MKYGEALSLLTSGEATEITREGWNNENITVSLHYFLQDGAGRTRTDGILIQSQVSLPLDHCTIKMR